MCFRHRSCWGHSPVSLSGAASRSPSQETGYICNLDDFFTEFNVNDHITNHSIRRCMIFEKKHVYRHKGVFKLRNTVVWLQHWGTIKYNIAQIYIRLFTEALKSEKGYARQLTFEMQFSLLGNRKKKQQTWLETFAFSASCSFLVSAFLSAYRKWTDALFSLFPHSIF